jgi:adenylate kinase family enzyme
MWYMAWHFEQVRLPEPLIDYYKKKGLVIEVSAMGTPDDVIQSVFRALGV